MTVARRRRLTVDLTATPMPKPDPVRPRVPGMGVPAQLGDAPAMDAVTPVGRLRRCTFRRLDRVSALPGRAQLPTYEVMCLYDDADEPMALGDIDAARPICEACIAPGIFRPDED